jgi:hypothetical protein
MVLEVTLSMLVIVFLLALIMGLIIGVALTRPNIR